MKGALLVPFFGLLHLCAMGQELPVGLGQQLEATAELGMKPEDDVLLQQLRHWQQHPLNLNMAAADDLRQFPFLTPLHIAHFLRYRALLGPLIALHELQAVPYWDVATIRQLLPFVWAGPGAFSLRSLQGGRHHLLVRMVRTAQRAAGFSTAGSSRFAGGPYKVLGRYQYRSSGGTQWGFTAEKDAGERFLAKGALLPDFFSAHFFAKPAGRLKALALGDFTVNLGQGLVHWQALAFGKSPVVLGIKRQAAPLRPSTGAAETRFLRGVGATLAQGCWSVTLFAAAQKVDANKSVNGWGQTIITRFGTSGLHRTAAELLDQKAVRQLAWGGTARYEKSWGSVGLNAVHYRFSYPLQKQAEPYNLYALQGRRFTNISTDYAFTWRNLHLFGELAVNARGAPALVQGMLLSVHPRLDVALHARLLHRGYTAVAADAFGESSTSANEHGLYSGFLLRAHPKLVVSAFADLYSFPWLRYRADAPSGGAEYLCQLTWQPQRGAEWYLRYRVRQKAENTGAAPLAVVLPHLLRNLRMHVGHTVGQWTLRSRAEIAWYQTEQEAKPQRGVLFYSEAQLRVAAKVSGTARLAYYKTDGYATRLYAYESDVLYGYAIPPLYGRGIRAYLLGHVQIARAIDVWAKIAHSMHPGQASMGTGPDKTTGNKRTEVKLQVVISW